jgi:hypothetical protein
MTITQELAAQGGDPVAVAWLGVGKWRRPTRGPRPQPARQRPLLGLRSCQVALLTGIEYPRSAGSCMCRRRPSPPVSEVRPGASRAVTAAADAGVPRR